MRPVVQVAEHVVVRVVDDDLRAIVDRKFNQDVVQAAGRTVKGLVSTGESQNLPPFIIGLVTGTTSLASYEGRAALERPWDPETYTPRSMTRFENRLPPFSDAPSIGEFVAWRHFGHGGLAQPGWQSLYRRREYSARAERAGRQAEGEEEAGRTEALREETGQEAGGEETPLTYRARRS